jgi:hypothetical protein
MLYPADPPTVEEIVCVMRHASEDPPVSSFALGRQGAEETERERLGLLAELHDT